MMRVISLFIFIIVVSTLFCACGNKGETVKPRYSSITESIYASGIVKSRDQYQAFASVNGIVEEVFVEEGDTVKRGDPILSISSETQRLNRENAMLSAQFSDLGANQGKLNEAKLAVELSLNKMKVDSALYFRQVTLWDQKIGTKVDLEQRELAFQNSKNVYYSSIVRYEDLKRQLELNALQTKKNLMISSKLESDFTLRSELNGRVYSLSRRAGELVSSQTPLATIGDARDFILEMQVDEYDILKVREGMIVVVALDSYKGKVYEARISKINPLMNERSKTFTVEAVFLEQPERLYPNLTFEANIVIQTKEKALIIPRNFTIDDTGVIDSRGKGIKISTGIKDYKMVEVLEGIGTETELQKPEQ